MLRLNLGCGEARLEGFVNVDIIENDVVKPDILCDVRRQRLPYEDGEVDDVYIIHCIEHIEIIYWDFIFTEVGRVLKPGGTFLLSYPEFGECAKRFINNTGNSRDFWRMTLYGRQLFPTDYHVSPMDSKMLKEMLDAYGFYRTSYRAESEAAPYNTILVALKDPSPNRREDVIARELHMANMDDSTKRFSNNFAASEEKRVKL